MALNVGATWAIIGHSERRNVFGESDEVSVCALPALCCRYQLQFCYDPLACEPVNLLS